MFNSNLGIGIYKGEIFALSAALFWAISTVLFKSLGKTIRPLELNLLKGSLAVILLGATSLLIREPITALPLLVILLLVVSGAVGIGFGDTMYFEALNKLGARRTLLLTILAPPLTAIFAWFFLSESLNIFSWIGIIITVLGVAWVITEKNNNSDEKNFNWMGVFFAFLAALAQAAGAVMSRWALTQSSVSALQSAVIRLLAGTAVLLIWIIVRREKIGQWTKPRPAPRMWVILAIVVLLGTYTAIWFQQLAFQFTKVGIAQTLLATSPLFILPIAALQGEKLSLRAIIGVFISIAGVSLLFLAS